jgi:phosphoribosylformimino-5-aminoimidazole carboxamide ribotide isomerase
MVAIRGWTEISTTPAVELARRVVQAGVRTLIYTDIARDGMLSGPDLTGAQSLQTVGASVVVSGGVASAAHIQAACHAGLGGVIVGRALYEGKLSLPEAIRAAACLSSS